MYIEHAPPAGLAHRIACVWEQTSAAEGVHLVVPDGCVDLIWGPQGPHVAGPDTGPMPTPMRPGDSYFGIRFRPGAVGGLLSAPLSDLLDQRVSLDDLAPDLADLPVEQRLRAVAHRLLQAPPPDPAAPAIASALRSGGGVAEVAWQLGLSERQLHRRSVAAFGYPPKTLQRIVRFQRALRLARAGVPLARVAADSGYADQAHLANDVKRLAGVPMKQLLA
ncbi:helix-turn-helix transcriptional regulator [Thermoactinospora rubra]|uniref:helix-turn-helix transcriptional regulator n=1 Tax=Thermoactinospora rubra TaxID=1088767 RepID=UPI000A0F449C|nr:helix-turn-helix transcriptional regulator [Thermoactinospora rubra]